MRKGVIAQFSSFSSLKAHLDSEKYMAAQAANKRDVEAAQRLRRASSLPKPAMGPRIAR